MKPLAPTAADARDHIEKAWKSVNDAAIALSFAKDERGKKYHGHYQDARDALELALTQVERIRQ